MTDIEASTGLLRQYFLKGTDLSAYFQAESGRVAVQLNGRPRETLHWRQPVEARNGLLAEHVSP